MIFATVQRIGTMKSPSFADRLTNGSSHFDLNSEAVQVKFSAELNGLDRLRIR